MFDSDCNTHITSFKERFHEYCEFDQTVIVYEFGERQTPTVDVESVILANEFGRQYILNKVLYISDAKHSMLSMMKLLRFEADLKFRDTSCTLTLKEDCMLYESAVDDLLYLNDFEKSEIHSLIIIMR